MLSLLFKKEWPWAYYWPFWILQIFVLLINKGIFKALFSAFSFYLKFCINCLSAKISKSFCFIFPHLVIAPKLGQHCWPCLTWSDHQRYLFKNLTKPTVYCTTWSQWSLKLIKSSINFPLLPFWSLSHQK